MSWIGIWHALGRGGRRILAGLVLLATVFGYHKARVGQAKRQGRAEQTDRINRATEKESHEIKQRANEIDRRNTGLADDERRRRMLEQARERDSS